MLKRKGFTLIEMLVVVLIIGILAAIAFPQYQIAVLKSRYTQLMVMADAIRQAQDAYYLVHGKYSLKINDLDITVPGDCNLSDSGGIIYCPKFSCVVNDGWVNAETIGGVYCFMPFKDSFLMYNITGLKRGGTRLCGVGDGSELGGKVCMSLGGEYSYVNPDGIYYYKL